MFSIASPRPLTAPLVTVCALVVVFRAAASDDDDVADGEIKAPPVSTPVILYMRIAGAKEAPAITCRRLEAELRGVDRAHRSSHAKEERLALRHESLDILEKLVFAEPELHTRQAWLREYVARLVGAGDVPEGLRSVKRLDDLCARLRRSDDTDALAYAELKRQWARHNLHVCHGGVYGLARQSAWLEHLRAFVKQFPDTRATAEALWELARGVELAGNEGEAREWYRRLADVFKDLDEGASAAGALARLDSLGKVVEVRGFTFDGKRFELAQLPDRAVVLHFWYPNKYSDQGVAVLQRLQMRFPPSKVAIVSVSRGSARSYLETLDAEQRLAWPQLVDSRSGDGRLEHQFGIVEYPTIMLLDRNHRVVNRRVDVTQLEAEVELLFEAAK